MYFLTALLKAQSGTSKIAVTASLHHSNLVIHSKELGGSFILYNNCTSHHIRQRVIILTSSLCKMREI